MADVFVSYARADATLVAPVVAAVEAHLLSVWFDRSLTSGMAFPEQINEQLLNCAAVVVCWSANSVRSQWVQAEALQALQQGKLIPILLDDCVVPVPFNSIHAVNVSGVAQLDSVALAPALLRIATLTRRPSLRDFVELKQMPTKERFAHFRARHRTDLLYPSARNVCREALGQELDDILVEEPDLEALDEQRIPSAPISTLTRKREVLATSQAAIVEHCASLVETALHSEFRYQEFERRLRSMLPQWRVGSTSIGWRKTEKNWRDEDVVTFEACDDIVQDVAEQIRPHIPDRFSRQTCEQLAQSLDTIDEEHALEGIASEGRIYRCENMKTNALVFVNLADAFIDVQVENEHEIDQAFDFKPFRASLAGVADAESLTVQFDAAKSWLEERFLEHCATLHLDPAAEAVPANTTPDPGQPKRPNGKGWLVFFVAVLGAWLAGQIFFGIRAALGL